MAEAQQPSGILSRNQVALRSLHRAIAFSQGQFSLVLVCCNYLHQQERIIQKIQENNPKVQKVILEPNAISLYRTIKLQLQQQNSQPSGVMVLGIETVEAVDDLLSATNHIRDEFRKHHSFPVVLWMNEEIMHKMMRLAPDFASWAATPIKFEMTTGDLLNFLHRETKSLFAKIIHLSATEDGQRQANNLISSLGLVWQHNFELGLAIEELKARDFNLDPELQAGAEFILGLDDYVGNRIDVAKSRFHKSLKFWQTATDDYLKDSPSLQNLFGSDFDIINNHNSPLLRQGVILFYLGLCYFRFAERNQAESCNYWQEAKKCFLESIQVLQTANRPDIVAQFIGQACEVLLQLKDWDELQKFSLLAVELHEKYGSYRQRACDFGFLAQVAKEKFLWEDASKYANIALINLADAVQKNEPQYLLFPSLLEQIYQLIFAKAQRHLSQKYSSNSSNFNNINISIDVYKEHLEKAKAMLKPALESSDYRFDPHRYIRYLRILRTLYFEEGLYLEAFEVRQKRRSIEQQYGLRAFVGTSPLEPQRQPTNPAAVSVATDATVALEITASGRERDIKRLLGRIGRPDQKVTIIHGPSGVGKSSIVTAGLVPALQHTAISDQMAVPIVVQFYTDWVKELGKSLTTQITRPIKTKINSLADILGQLKANAANQLITVLIFDQFEEFFFDFPNQQSQADFDGFLRDCLNIPFVKIIFSLREDYLHFLLNFKKLATSEGVANNILDKNIRYPLNNFSPSEAKTIIQSLTERSQFHLEADLVNALVIDLAGNFGEIRPIELQILGTQLQDRKIIKLEQYEKFRPNKLIEQYLKELIKECGPENERTALFVLSFLIDEQNKRPLKTCQQLADDLEDLEDSEKLDLVLEILVTSGLVVVFPGQPEYYQLIHDYLVDLIRILQLEEPSLQRQVNNLKNRVEQSQSKIDELSNAIEFLQKENEFTAKLVDNKEKQKVTSKLPTRDTQFPPGRDLVGEIRELKKREEISQLEILQLQRQKELASRLAESLEFQRRSEIKANSSLKLALTGSCLTIFILIASIGIIWRQGVISQITALSATSEALFASHKGIDALKTSIKAGRNQQSVFLSDKYTEQVVRTALYQSVYGIREKNRLEAHTGGINSIAISPDGSTIASASSDNSIKLWRPDGNLIATLSGHTAKVNSVSINNNGLIASASNDNLIKIWSRDGKKEIKTLTTHKNSVSAVAWSPNGQQLASSSNDETVKIWSANGKVIKNLEGHKGVVLDIAWSPKGEFIASGGEDKRVKIWSRDGKLVNTLSEENGHRDTILAVAWSIDGKTIASASLDNTIKLWSLEGKLIKTLSGHAAGVRSVTFSSDGKYIASASTDETVKLWTNKSNNSNLVLTLKGHSNWVNSVRFTRDSLSLISGSRDKTVKIWKLHNDSLPTLQAHDDSITGISFSPDGSLMATSSLDKKVKLWNREGNQIKLITEFTKHPKEVWDVSFSPDGNRIASVGKDKKLIIWDKKGKLLHTSEGHKYAIHSVTWSPDGKTLATGSEDNTVIIWSREGKKLKILKGHTDAVNWVSFSPDGKLIASASDDKTIRIWDKDGKLIAVTNDKESHQLRVYSLAWSPDSSKIASVSNDGSVKLWNSNAQLMRTLDTSGDWFNSIAFSPDGKTLAATSDDKVKLWDKDGNLVITLKGLRENLTRVVFTPDGKSLVLTGAKGTLIFQDLADTQLGRLLNKGCGWLGNYLKNNQKLMPGDRTLCK